jgi:hypothetical protein
MHSVSIMGQQIGFGTLCKNEALRFFAMTCGVNQTAKTLLHLHLCEYPCANTCVVYENKLDADYGEQSLMRASYRADGKAETLFFLLP